MQSEIITPPIRILNNAQVTKREVKLLLAAFGLRGRLLMLYKLFKNDFVGLYADINYNCIMWGFSCMFLLSQCIQHYVLRRPVEEFSFKPIVLAKEIGTWILFLIYIKSQLCS